MISSVLYHTRSSRLDQSTIYIPDKALLIEILLFKIVILLILFIFPPIVGEGKLCIVITVLVAFDFWMTKNLGRKILSAYWYIDTEGQEDQWVYQASLKSPTSVYQAIFWYSFIGFGVMLLIIGILTIIDSKLSLFCSILIASIANYVNFFAFSNIIQMRNSGTLQKIKNELENQDGIIQTIKLPLIYKSKLQQIPEQISLQAKGYNNNNF